MTGLVAAGKGATGHGINDAGHVTGRMFVAGASRAFLYANGTVTNLGGFGEASSFGAGINARGEVIVVAYTFPGGGATRSFVVFGEVATPLGTLGGASTFATAINERGDVTGGSETATGDFHAFLYANGTMTDLGTLAPGPGRSSGGAGINGARDVVGDAYTADGRRHAILITGGRVYDLNALVLGGLAPGDDLRFASAINDRGQIVANAICETVITPVQPCHAYRLDPVPSTAEVPALGPVSLAMLAIVLVILTRRPLTLRPGARQR
jgi:probable HAF family extracellular repeat protein